MERDGIEDGWRRFLDSLKGFWGKYWINPDVAMVWRK